MEEETGYYIEKPLRKKDIYSRDKELLEIIRDVK